MTGIQFCENTECDYWKPKIQCCNVDAIVLDKHGICHASKFSITQKPKTTGEFTEQQKAVLEQVMNKKASLCTKLKMCILCPYLITAKVGRREYEFCALIVTAATLNTMYKEENQQQ